jgi:hypothetical protein
MGASSQGEAEQGAAELLAKRIRKTMAVRSDFIEQAPLKIDERETG